MIQIIVLFLAVVAFVVSFFSLLGGWLILGLPAAYFCLTLGLIRLKRYQIFPELSDRANQLLRRYGHFYLYPFASRDFSSSASTLSFAAIPVCVVGLFKGFWIGIAITIGYYFLLAFVASRYNPMPFFTSLDDKLAHEELVGFIQERQDRARLERQREK